MKSVSISNEFKYKKHIGLERKLNSQSVGMWAINYLGPFVKKWKRPRHGPSHQQDFWAVLPI